MAADCPGVIGKAKNAGTVGAAAASLDYAVGKHKTQSMQQTSLARPNHSVNLTRNGRPRWLSAAHFVYSAALSQRVLPLRAGYLER